MLKTKRWIGPTSFESAASRPAGVLQQVMPPQLGFPKPRRCGYKCDTMIGACEYSYNS